MQVLLRMSSREPVDSNKKGFTVKGVRVDCQLKSKNGHEFVQFSTPLIGGIASVNIDKNDGTSRVSVGYPIIDYDIMQGLLDKSIKETGKCDAREAAYAATKTPWQNKFYGGYMGNLVDCLNSWVNEQKGTDGGKGDSLAPDKPKPTSKKGK